MSDFELQRLGLVMEPEPGNPLEAEGVLNPAAVRGPDGQLYLFPRLVARGNYVVVAGNDPLEPHAPCLQRVSLLPIVAVLVIDLAGDRSAAHADVVEDQ